MFYLSPDLGFEFGGGTDPAANFRGGSQQKTSNLQREKTAHNRNVRICAKKSKHNDGRGTYARFALMKTLQGPNLGERG